MTLEIILQLLVFPGLGWLALSLQDLKISVAVFGQRLTALEKEQLKHETQDTCPHCVKHRANACGSD